MFRENFSRIGLAFIVFLSMMGVVPVRALSADILDQQEVVDKARFTLATFAGHPSMTVLQSQLKQARAVFVAPNLLKGSFIFGGSFGTGVLMVRNEETQSWSDPAFYAMTSGSFGFQIGSRGVRGRLVGYDGERREVTSENQRHAWGRGQVGRRPGRRGARRQYHSIVERRYDCLFSVEGSVWRVFL